MLKEKYYLMNRGVYAPCTIKDLDFFEGINSK